MTDEHLLAERLLAERDERRRIAELLHDGPVQHVAALTQMLDAALQALDAAEPDAARRVASRALDVARDAAEELREIVADLEPATLHEHGLAAAVNELLARTAVRRDLAYEVAIDERGLGEGARSGLYQIVREAVDQAVRRGPPTHVRVALEPTSAGGVALAVRDDGAPERRQTVLDGLGERAAELNGTFAASREERWTEVRVVLPPSAASM